MIIDLHYEHAYGNDNTKMVYPHIPTSGDNACLPRHNPFIFLSLSLYLVIPESKAVTSSLLCKSTWLYQWKYEIHLPAPWNLVWSKLLQVSWVDKPRLEWHPFFSLLESNMEDYFFSKTGVESIFHSSLRTQFTSSAFENFIINQPFARFFTVGSGECFYDQELSTHSFRVLRLNCLPLSL